MTEYAGETERGMIRRTFGALAALLALIWRLVLTLLLIVMVAGLWFMATGGPTPKVPRASVLVWAPQGDLTEQPVGERKGAWIRSLLREKAEKTRVADLVNVLDRAAGDARIKALVLKVDDMGRAGLAQLQELAAAIRRFKATGKPVTASSYRYNQPQYLLAAQADTIALDPMGDVFLKGFGLYQYYLAEVLNALGIKAQIFRVGKYKSAVESFSRTDMSPEAREESRVLLAALWDIYKQELVAGRQLNPEAIDALIERYAERLAAERGDAAQTALKAGLVNRLVSPEKLQGEFAASLREDTGEDTYREMDDRDYLAATDAETAGAARKSIGLIVVSGPIVDGQTLPGTTGSDQVTELIEQGLKDESVAALVVRIDSPGGSMDGSEKVRRQLALARERGKPVVVSMSEMAASGGYWIAVNADRIFAEEATITGSIGIFAIQPSFGPLLAKLGVHVDGVQTTPLADAMRADRPLSPEMGRILQSQIEHAYQRFIALVAEGRRLKPDEVQRIAQGRVWSGRDAQRLGLVDEIGGLQAATESAARLAKLEAGEYQLIPLTELSQLAQRLSEWLADELKQLIPQASLPLSRNVGRLPFYREEWDLNWLGDGGGIYAYCPCKPDIGAAER
jgi:protease-4